VNGNYLAHTAATAAETSSPTTPVTIHRQSPDHNHPNPPTASNTVPTATTGCKGSLVVIVGRVGPRNYGVTGGTTMCIDQETRDQTTATSGRPRHRHQSWGPRNGVPPFTAVCCPSEGQRTRACSQADEDGPGPPLGQGATRDSWSIHPPSCSAPDPRPDGDVTTIVGCRPTRPTDGSTPPRNPEQHFRVLTLVPGGILPSSPYLRQVAKNNCNIAHPLGGSG
jgi:hypothetical protein